MIDLGCKRSPLSSVVDSIEIELTSSAIEKLSLLASMQIPEVWRHNGVQLEMFRRVDGAYQPIAASQELPGLSAETVLQFLSLRFEIGESSLIGEFRRLIDNKHR